MKVSTQNPGCIQAKRCSNPSCKSKACKTTASNQEGWKDLRMVSISSTEDSIG